MSVKDRLLQFIEKTGLNTSQFEKKCNISNGYVNNIRKSIGEEILIKIEAAYPELNKIWLLHGEGSMEKEPESKTMSDPAPPSYTEKRRQLKNTTQNTLTYYDVGASAGIQGDILPVNKKTGVLYISDLFRGSQFAIRISGNSMIPSYPPGAIIGIREVQDKQITPGAVYVIERRNELWIKRLFYKEDRQETGMFECISDNTMKYEKGAREGKLFYPPFYLDIDKVTRLFKVTGIYKSNELTVIQ